jgi:hypothetical protein
VIFAEADVQSGQFLRAALAHDDAPSPNSHAIVHFDTETL